MSLATALTAPASAAPTIAVDLRALVAAPSGLGFYTRSLLLGLAERGRLRLLGLAHRPSSVAEELLRAGIRLEVQPAPLGFLWQHLRLPRRLEQGDVDLLWSPLSTLPWRCSVPAVVTIADLTPLLFPEVHRLKVRLSVLLVLRRTLDLARRVVAISRATADDLVHHFPECAAKVRVIYPGIDPEFVPATSEAIAQTRARLGCPDGYLLYAGTLEPRKNLGVLLDAWEALLANDPATPPLLLAGPYGWHSRNLLRRLECLTPRGLRVLGRLERPELVRLVQGARLFVYPSLYEGFGLPPAEAMACAVPVVVSTAASLPEVVGDAGLAVEPDDAEGLAGAILHLLSEPEAARQLGRKGRERIRGFTWERAAAEMEELFLETVAGSAGATQSRARS